jgi:hypothetical protein
MWMSRWSRLLPALVLCVAATACGGAANQESIPFEQSGASADAPASDSGSSGSSGESPEQQSDRARGVPGVPGSPGAPGAPGAPGNGGGNAQALGAPLKMPDIQQVGAPMSSAEPQIRELFEERCNHQEPCVNLVVDPADYDPDTCTFSRTEPNGTTFHRGDTITLVCNPEETSGESTDTTDTTDTTEQPDTTDATDSTQPTDTTGSTDGGQPSDT